MNIRERLQSIPVLAGLFWLALAAALCLPLLQTPMVLQIDSGMRMLEASDLASGQAWTDTTQYRDNIPFGGPMHWSRLIDAPIALLIVGLKPFLGDAAFSAAAAIWPLIVLLGLAFALAVLTQRLVGRPGPMIVLLIAATSFPLYTQFRPGQVDHHNVQVVLALLTILAVINARANWRWAVLAGILTATIVAIGAEGLPVVGAALLVVPLYWVAEPQPNLRPLVAFALSFAVATLLHLVAVTAPSAWFAEHCDAISATYVTGAALYALAVVAAVGLGGRLNGGGQRFLALAMLGGVAIGVALWLNPDCIRGPYGNVDPALAPILLKSAAEAQPLWEWIWPLLPNHSILIVPVTGLVAAALAAIYDRPRRVDWLVLLAFCVTAVLTTVLQVRGVRMAGILVLPAGAWAIATVWDRFHRTQSLAAAGRLVLVCFAFIGALHWSLAGMVFRAVVPPRGETYDMIYAACADTENYKHLASLPPGRVMNWPTLGTSILLNSPHTTVSAGYHRNEQGVRDAIRFFSGNEAEAQAVVRERDLNYLVFCRDIPPGEGLDISASFSGTEWPWLTRLTTPDELIQIYSIHLPPKDGAASPL